MKSYRKVVAGLADDLCEGRISYDQFMGSLPPESEEDEEIFQLVDLITHEPQEGSGLSDADHQLYRSDIRSRISKLMNEEANQPAQTRTTGGPV